MEANAYKISYTEMLTAALFVTGPNWEQLKCTSPGEQINKLIYIFMMKYHSATKKNGLLVLTYETIEEFQNNYAERKKPDKRIHKILFI